MFFRRKHTDANQVDYGILNADIHSHLLPGIDDGSQDMETSLQLIKGMRDLGFKKLITTPHIMWDMYKNTRSIIEEKLEEVKTRLREEGIEVTLEAALRDRLRGPR